MKSKIKCLLFFLLLFCGYSRKWTVFEVGTNASYLPITDIKHKKKKWESLVRKHLQKYSSMEKYWSQTGHLLSRHLFLWHSFNKLESGSFFVHFLSKSFPFLDFVTSRDLSSHLYDWSSQKASPTSRCSLNLNESHHFFSLTLITFLYISITTTSHPLSISTSSQYLCRVLSSSPNCIINYHSLKTKLPVFCPYHRCWLNSWDECKAEYLVVDEYVKWVSEWVSELWFLRIFSAPGNVLRAEREGDEHDSFITELTAWQYFL